MDADALFAGAASVSNASHVILQLGELGIVEVSVPDQSPHRGRAKPESEASGGAACLPNPGRCVHHALAMAPIRISNRLARAEEADPKDAPILRAAIAGRCRWLVTFNVRDYRTDQLRVSLPGPFLEELRAMLVRHR